MVSTLSLKVQRIEQVCLFELTWVQGQRMSVQIPYPETLTSLYRSWQEAYLQFHGSGQRARPGLVSGMGVIPAIDWRARLVQAEAALLSEFHHWLSHADLLEIRSMLAKIVATTDQNTVELFLTCDPIEVIRLPWEAWEVGAEFGSSKPIRVIRMPMKIRSGRDRQSGDRLRKRLRILAILGDDTGLDFEIEKKALQSLKLTDVEFVGWQPHQPLGTVKEQICQAISDPVGWDVLFFAGHSNDVDQVGGELGIAPHQSMFVQELVPYLRTALEKGLQFAVFNSCKGIPIAQSLIDMGLSEVAVMREPISNAVAQTFLVQFIQSLATGHDVHTAVLDACDYLKLEKSVTYPSAHLVPSVFRHPESTSFRPDFRPWRQRLKQWSPTKREQWAIAACVLLSVLPSVRSLLLDQRLLVQSVYRSVTQQIPPQTTPPVTLIQIDETSLQKEGISQPNPMNRQYLAKIIDQLTQNNAKVIGIDYFFDRPQREHDDRLATAIQTSVSKQETWFVFATHLENGKQVGVLPSTQIASRSSSIQGYTNAPQWFVALPDRGGDCVQCPFAYSLAMARLLQMEPTVTQPQSLAQGRDFWAETGEATRALAKSNRSVRFLQSLQESPLTQVSRFFEQIWLQPVLDFSIPPDRVFRPIPAWQLLDAQKSKTIGDLSQTVVVIAPGGYGGAGIELAKQDFKDAFTAPAAIDYWQSTPRDFTGGEGLSYMIHHLLRQRLVIPIPDLWFVIITAAVIKGIQLMRVRRKRYVLIGGVTVYSLASLQLFVSAAIVLPIVLPGLLVVLYNLPWTRRTSRD